MRFRDSLDEILGQKIKVRILRCLAQKGVELTGRQLAGEVGMSPPSIHEALKQLATQHVVLERRAGKALLFKINDQNCLVQEMLLPLFAGEAGLLKESLAKLLKIMRPSLISVLLYGSLTRKQDAPHSDIDLLVVVKPGRKIKVEADFDKVSADFLARYGRTLSPYIITADDLQKRYKGRDPFIVEVIKTGIVIYGKLVSELLSYGR